MQDTSTHFAMVVRAPSLPVPSLKMGKWVLVHMGEDLLQVSSRFRSMQSIFGSRPDMQMFVLSFRSGSSSEIRCLGRWRTPTLPPLVVVATMNAVDRHEFWQGVDQAVRLQKEQEKARRLAEDGEFERRFSSAVLVVGTMMTLAFLVPVGMVVLRMLDGLFPGALAR